jgi:hypothetical protein
MNTVHHLFPLFVRFRRSVSVAALLFAFGIVAGCEDPAPNEYVPVPYVEGYLFVDHPIEGITVLTSQPLSEEYDQSRAIMRDAEVTIESNGTRYSLVYDPSGGGSYRYPDTSVTVLPNTRYALTVRFPDGQVLTGETTTPARIAWTRLPYSVLQYPSDTTTLLSPDSLRISWTPGSTTEYLIRVRCLDTLGYGRWLDPPTDEINGRTNNLGRFETPETPTFYGTARWGFVQTTNVPTVWTAFRWYGRHEVAILSPDKHFMDWFKLTRFSGAPQYNEEFSNIRGGVGVFGSASIIAHDAFLLKRKK